MTSITYHIRAGVTKRLEGDIEKVLHKAVLQEIIHECADRLTDALTAVIDLERLSPEDYVGEGLHLQIRIDKAEEAEE